MARFRFIDLRARTREPEPGIAIKEWDPNTPYLQALKKVRLYLNQRKKFGTSPVLAYRLLQLGQLDLVWLVRTDSQTRSVVTRKLRGV